MAAKFDAKVGAPALETAAVNAVVGVVVGFCPNTGAVVAEVVTEL